MPAINWLHLAIGLALCLGGWLLYWAGMHLTGGLIGGCLGVAAGWAVGAVVTPNAMVWTVPIAGLIGFGVGIFLIRGLHRFLFFFLGSTVGMIAGYGVFALCLPRVDWIAMAPTPWEVAFVIAGSIVGGVILVWGSRWAVALVASIVGALFVTTSVDEPLLLLAAIPLAVGSFFLQIGVLRRLMPSARQEVKEAE